MFLTSSKNPAVTGQKVTFTATVPGATAGSVAFTVAGKPVKQCAAVPLPGSAKCTLSFAKRGSRVIDTTITGGAYDVPTLIEKVNWGLKLRGKPKLRKHRILRVKLKCAKGTGGCHVKLRLKGKHHVGGHRKAKLKAGKTKTVKLRVRHFRRERARLAVSLTGKRQHGRVKRVRVRLR